MPYLHAASFPDDDNQPLLQDRVAKVDTFINSLASTPATSSSTSSTDTSASSSGNRSSAVLRGPALAHVEVAKRKLQLGVADQAQLVQALLQYHERWVRRASKLFCMRRAG